MELRVDPKRMDADGTTGIYVRAWMPEGSAKSVDIAALDKESLLSWIRSSQDRIGEQVNFAERLILSLLGYEMSDGHQRSD